MKADQSGKRKIFLTLDSIGGSPPASMSNTFHFLFSDNRLATTEPAEPAPTTMKSYSFESCLTGK